MYSTNDETAPGRTPVSMRRRTYRIARTTPRMYILSMTLRARTPKGRNTPRPFDTITEHPAPGAYFTNLGSGGSEIVFGAR